MKAIEKLSDDQVLALRQFVAGAGKTWRGKLARVWESGDYPAWTTRDQQAHLQQIRNQHGPELLPKLDTCEVIEQGDAVAAAYQIGCGEVRP